MKPILIALLLAGTASAQWVASNSGSAAANAKIDAKPAYQLVAGAPASLACTAGKDFAFDTVGHVWYGCSVTGNPGTWVQLSYVLAPPSPTTLGGVESKDCTSGGQFLQKINTDGTETCGTPAGGGNVSGPGTVTNGYLPQWGASNNLLTTGLPVSTTPAANTVPEAGAGGTIAAGWLPAPGATTLGGVESKDCTSGGQFLQKINTDGTETCGTPAGGGNVSGPGAVTNSYLPQWGASNNLLTTGLPVSATAGANTVPESGAGGKLDIGWIPNVPAGQVTGLAPSATTDATNAANIASGTLPAGRLPNPGASSLGGVQSKDCSGSGQFLQKINTDGTETCATPGGVAFTTGTGYPHATCSSGDSYAQTDAKSGQSIWVCGAGNIWTNQGSQLISSGVTIPTSGRVFTYDLGSSTPFTDLSAAGNNATNGCTTYGNATSVPGTGVTFAGNQCFTAPYTGAAAVTACYATQNIGSQQTLLGNANNGMIVLTPWGGTPNVAGWTFPSLVPNWVPGGNHCLTLVYGADAASTHLYFDGVETAYVYNQGQAAPGLSTIGFGGDIGFAGQLVDFYGTIYYATAYTSAPSAAAIRADVASIAYTLSTRAIYLNNTDSGNYVIGLGDSILAGSVYSGTWFHVAGSHLTPTYRFLNVAKAGDTEASFAALMPNLFPASLYSPTGRIFNVVDQAGSNDLCGASVVATTETARQTVAAGIHANGGKVLWVPILPRSGCGNGGFDTDRKAFNSWMSTHWSTLADAYASYESDPVIGTGTIAINNTACLADGTHPSGGNFCDILQAQYLEDALRAMLGLPTPRLLASATLTAQTASISTASIVTAPAPGSYRLWATLVPSTAASSGAGCSITVTLGWTDPSGAQTATSASVSLTTLNAGAFLTTPLVVASGNLTYATTLTGGTCAGEQYQLYVRADSWVN